MVSWKWGPWEKYLWDPTTNIYSLQWSWGHGKVFMGPKNQYLQFVPTLLRSAWNVNEIFATQTVPIEPLETYKTCSVLRAPCLAYDLRNFYF